MTVEPSWRIECVDKRWHVRHSNITIPHDGSCFVPDSRVDALAAAWNGESMELRIARTGLYETWPELARGIDLAIGEGLPDALTEEDLTTNEVSIHDNLVVKPECEHPVVRPDDYCESCDDYMGKGAWRKAAGLDLKEER